MKKLNERKIRWILRAKNRGYTKKEVSQIYKITPRWVQKLWSEYRRTGHIRIRPVGRPRKSIPLKQIKLILTEHPRNSGAKILEKKIFAKHKIRIPHNTIHMVLKQAGYANDEPNKQKRRKPWIRFERRHSLSLVQTDWHESKNVPGKWMIPFLDDASRKLLAIDEYDNPTAENAIMTLKKAIKESLPYGGIKAVLSDNGSQFLEQFDNELNRYGIKHIHSRVKHPQTMGKVERFNQTYKKHRSKFKTLEEFKEWYNEERMHMSLNMRYAETPSQAFIRKMDPAVWLSKVKWFG